MNETDVFQFYEKNGKKEGVEVWLPWSKIIFIDLKQKLREIAQPMTKFKIFQIFLNDFKLFQVKFKLFLKYTYKKGVKFCTFLSKMCQTVLKFWKSFSNFLGVCPGGLYFGLFLKNRFRVSLNFTVDASDPLIWLIV